MFSLSTIDSSLRHNHRRAAQAETPHASPACFIPNAKRCLFVTEKRKESLYMTLGRFTLPSPDSTSPLAPLDPTHSKLGPVFRGLVPKNPASFEAATVPIRTLPSLPHTLGHQVSHTSCTVPVSSGWAQPMLVPFLWATRCVPHLRLGPWRTKKGNEHIALFKTKQKGEAKLYDG